MNALESEVRRTVSGCLLRPWVAGLVLALLTTVALEAGRTSVGRAWAQNLERPQGRVILTLSGRIGRTNGDGTAEFDRSMLEALPTAVIETMTPWTNGTMKFEGPLARDVMKRVGATGSLVKATAINDYSVEIPLSDFEAYPVILAMKMNGEALRTRSRGPLWVIYPWSEHSRLRTEEIYVRSIWQVKEMVVKD